ncbi:DUF6275 family protein [Carnobacterium inhibens]|uniref:DUF6275 family protein n=1 Tax=Carnobacterium inhibens TaxID=147709 RepID=UPI0005593099|nr:DUF6275 family protein [Carnobacterium inhibens]
MDSQEFIDRCKVLVAEYTNNHLDVTDNKAIIPREVYVVWSAKTLQNNKALLSTPLSDGMYYEVTFNGDKNEIYFDAYKKFENIKYDL